MRLGHGALRAEADQEADCAIDQVAEAVGELVGAGREKFRSKVGVT